VALHGFLMIIAAGMIIGLAILGGVFGGTQADPRGGGFRFDLGEQKLTGTLIAKPYPMIWLDQESDSQIWSRMIILNGNGKTGVGERAAKFDGSRIVANGVLLERGDLQMLQINRQFEAIPSQNAEFPERVNLGRWRLSGEICDGRCYVGAMRPGEGVAHKACANLCIEGGQPPVFVANSPVEGSSYMLLGTEDYGPLPIEVLKYSGVLVELEGRLEQVGDVVLLLLESLSASIRPGAITSNGCLLGLVFLSRAGATAIISGMAWRVDDVAGTNTRDPCVPGPVFLAVGWKQGQQGSEHLIIARDRRREHMFEMFVQSCG